MIGAGEVPEDQALLLRARGNDRQALAELYDLYALRIYGYLYRKVSSAQVAEDLTGDVFVKVLEAVRSNRPWRTSFRAWLYRIAHNVLVDWYRSHASDDRVSIEADSREVEALGPEYLSATIRSYTDLKRALASLTESQQMVLELRFGEGLKAREVAEAIGRSLGAVEALQHRALEALREYLED
jgi:RNA polymerase sigma-70 factor, ECF subfamily